MNWHSGTIILKWLHFRIRTNFLINLTAQLWKRLCSELIMSNLSVEAAREWVPTCLGYCHAGLCSIVTFELDDLKGLPTMRFNFKKAFETQLWFFIKLIWDFIQHICLYIMFIYFGNICYLHIWIYSSLKFYTLLFLYKTLHTKTILDDKYIERYISNHYFSISILFLFFTILTILAIYSHYIIEF